MQNRRKILGGMLLLSFIAAGCSKKDTGAADTGGAMSATPATASTDRSADAAAILAADSGWIRSVMAKNLDSLMSYYTSDAVSYGFGAPAKGMSEVRASYAEMLKSTMTNPSVSSNPAMFSDDGTMAFDYGTYTGTTTAPGGKPSTDTSGYLNVWKKIDGTWKLVAEMSTPITTKKM